MIFKTLLKKISFILGFGSRLEQIQLTLGRIEARQLAMMKSETPSDWEFQITSQWGEDGIIQFLISRVSIKRTVFVEFGVESYAEANTRYLLQNNYWSGLVIDGSEKHIQRIKESNLYWRYNLKAHASFITRENINTLISSNGITGEIGILSVDIDGNDYWVWNDITVVQAAIVIAEYNSLFGPSATISVPYKADFVRNQDGKPNTYYGASIAALTYLANKKGYELVYGNRAGNNLFFVRKDLIGNLRALTPEEAYAVAPFRESRDANGNLTFPDFQTAQQELYAHTVIDVRSNKEILVKDALGV
jgi:hypothetical protein